MTTHEAAKLIAAALNSTPDVTAKTWCKGDKSRVYVSVDGCEVGFIEVGSRRPFDGISKHSGLISCAAERAVKLTGSRAEDLEVVALAETPRLPAEPRDENEAQAREDGESWIDQYGCRWSAGK
jgi:hypothetical protein